MKRFWMIFLAAAVLLSLSACGVGDVGGASSQSASSAASSQAPSALSQKVKEDSVPDSLSGLQKYLQGNASVTGTAEKMRADIIGAVSGVRYQYSYGGGKNNVTLELYEYDPSKLNAAAQKVLSQVRANGGFTLLGQKIGAVLSDNGKYLMIYKNSATDSGNKAYTDQIAKLFRGFKK